MKNSLKTDLLFVVGMIMLLTGAYLTLSSWAFGAEPPNIVNTDDAATAAYWTSSRMAAIRPMPLPQADVPIPSLFGTQGLRFTSSRLTYDSPPLGDCDSWPLRSGRALALLYELAVCSRDSQGCSHDGSVFLASSLYHT